MLVKFLKDNTSTEQPIRRIPYHTEQKVLKEVYRLLLLYMIEKPDEPTAWLNQVVVVAKPASRKIRISRDMRQANRAVMSSEKDK